MKSIIIEPIKNGFIVSPYTPNVTSHMEDMKAYTSISDLQNDLPMLLEHPDYINKSSASLAQDYIDNLSSKCQPT